MINRLDFIAVPSRDAERSRGFYLETLGLTQSHGQSVAAPRLVRVFSHQAREVGDAVNGHGQAANDSPSVSVTSRSGARRAASRAARMPTTSRPNRSSAVTTAASG